MNPKINIVYAEDYCMEREGVVRLLSDYPELNFEQCVSNGIELLDWLGKNEQKPPDIILLDISMPFMDGTKAFAIIRNRYPRLKVVMLTENYTDSYIAEFVGNGAKGFLSKNSRPETIAETLRRVHVNGICIDPVISNILSRAKVLTTVGMPADDRPDLGLNSLQIKVLRCMLRGVETDAIADEVNCAYKTAEHARSDVWKISGCKRKNFPELMEYAFKHGVINF